MSFEAIAWVRREGAIGTFEQKWLTVPTADTGAAIAAFRAIGYETRGISVLTQEEASKAAQRI